LTKFMIMKKFFPFILCAALSVSSYAQSTFTLTTPPCHDDGILTASFPTSLTPPLTVTWQTYGTSGAAIIHTGVSGFSDALTGYSGGELTVSATDALGITDSSALYPGAPPFTICSIGALPGLCPALDTISANVCAGGTGPFTYQWYNITTSAFVGTGGTLYVPAGLYGVTVTDATGCTFGSLVSSISDYAYTIPSFYDSIATTPANCTNGTAVVHTYSGGVPPFTYLWSNGATTDSIFGLVMGAYSVKVTDAVGCTADSVLGFVRQSITITAPIVATPATCVASNGAVIAFGSGGTPPYSYLWSNGATTQSQSGLTAGSYNVIVTDANGCIGGSYGSVTASTPITVTYTATPSLCTTPDGTATISPVGGTAPYTTTWATSPAQYGLTAINLTYGLYYFSVTDDSGCVQSGTVYVPPIDVMSATFAATPALCTLSNGSLTVYPAGGVTPYSYSWSTGATTAGISSEPAGDYTVVITDALDCKITKEPYLPYNSPIGIGVNTTPATCIFNSDGMDSVAVWGGTAPYTYAWSNGGTTAGISGLPHGPYWVGVTDSLGCTSPWMYSYVGYDTSSSCYCTITGTVYYDANDNCIQDPGEAGIPNIQIYISGRGYTYTDASGHYSYKVPSGSYTVSETVLTFYPLSSCQPNNVAVVSVAGGGCVNTVNFANTIDTIHDMHISTWDYDLPRPIPGHSYSHVTIVSNHGTIPEDSIYVTYNPDGQLFAPTFTPGGDFSGSSYQYQSTSSFPTLMPGASQEFFMTYNVPTDIPLGTPVVFKDSVSYKAPITNWLTDYSPWNNVNYFTTYTVGSFDPNFKEVSPVGKGSQGYINYTDSTLEYMVHFQNTGTAPAENVVVVDTLDNNLNWTSLTPIFESGNNCRVMLTQSGSSKIAQFIFNEINLPTKASDEVRSNGMLTYSVKLMPNLAHGTQIKNRASIYFDYNAPIMTNTTLNTIDTAASSSVNSVKSIAALYNTFNIYPNPANQTFNAVINSDAGGNAIMNVSDITGRVLISKTITLQKGSQTISVDASQLAPGNYFVTIDRNGLQQTQKLVIIKS